MSVDRLPAHADCAFGFRRSVVVLTDTNRNTMSGHDEHDGALFGICNPLLDISVNAEQELFDRSVLLLFVHFRHGNPVFLLP